MATMFDSFTKTFKDVASKYKSVGKDMASKYRATGEEIGKKYAAKAQAQAKEFQTKIPDYQKQSQGFFDKLKGSFGGNKASSSTNSYVAKTVPASSSVPMSQIAPKGKGVFQLHSKKNLALVPILLSVAAGIYFLTRKTRRK